MSSNAGATEKQLLDEFIIKFPKTVILKNHEFQVKNPERTRFLIKHETEVRQARKPSSP
jgi:hypothetical protein